METFDEIMQKTYYKKEAFFVDMFGKIKSNETTLYGDRNNCKDKKHVEKWLTINDLLNVAFYLNQDWQPDWANDQQKKYIICFHEENFIAQQTNKPISFVYFSSEELTQKAIQIIGKEALTKIFL